MGEGFGGFGGFGGGGGGEEEGKEEKEGEEREEKEATRVEKVGAVVEHAGLYAVCFISLCVGCGGRGEEGGRKE